MKFLLLIYNDPAKLEAIKGEQFNAEMRDCLAHADQLRAGGCLLDTQMLEDPDQAKSVRMRNGRLVATDGPFAETKEQLGGFILIEARDLNDAIQVAGKIPLARLGSIEVRPIKELRP